MDLPPLSARYDEYQVQAGTNSVELQFSGLSHRSDLGVSLIAADSGTTGDPITLPISGTDVRICLAADRSAAGGDIYVVLDNHHSGAPVNITGSYKVIGRSTCATQLTGSLNISLDGKGGGFSSVQTATLKPQLVSTASGWALRSAASSYSASYKSTAPADCPGGTKTTTASGKGPMTQGPPPDLTASAYQSSYSDPANFGNIFLATETATGTYSSPCGSGSETVPLELVPVYCPASANLVLGKYTSGDTAVNVNCSSQYPFAGLIYTATLKGSLTAKNPMPCGLWIPGQAFCPINATAPAARPRPR